MSGVSHDSLAIVYKRGDADWDKWVSEYHNPALEAESGYCLDAKEWMPSGSTIQKYSPNSVFKAWVEPRISMRGEDWLWIDCPLTGVRLRVPGGFDLAQLGVA